MTSQPPAACPRCASIKVALIGRKHDALTCGNCGGTWAVAPNPLYLVPLGALYFDRGECRVCGRVLARTWRGNGALIVHGPHTSRCPGSGQPAALPDFPAAA